MCERLRDAAIALLPNEAELYASRSRVYLRRGDYRAAFDDAQRGIELRPGHGQSYVARAHAATALGEFTTAQNDIARALKLGQVHEAYLARAMLHCRQNALDAALEDADHAIEHAPHDASTYILRSVIRAARNDAAGAAADRQKALELRPDADFATRRVPDPR